MIVSFSVWPTELGPWEPSVFELFRQYPRVEMEMTDDEWSAFSSSLERQGLTLREVERDIASGQSPANDDPRSDRLGAD